MKIHVRLFANLVELAGMSHVELSVPSALSVSQIRPLLSDMLHLPIEIVNQTMIAVNQTYAETTDILHENDEVALIPPVGGGSGEQASLIRITDAVLSVEDAYRQMEDPKYGGTVLFVGTVREWTKGRETTHLEYEAYPEMAKRQLEALNTEIARDYPDVQILIWHRVGRLVPTDVAVICAAASPHRAIAFEVARTLIERLKKEIPIWKKEFFADGEATWQPNP